MNQDSTNEAFKRGWAAFDSGIPLEDMAAGDETSGWIHAREENRARWRDYDECRLGRTA